METVLEYRGYKINYKVNELSLTDYIRHLVKNRWGGRFYGREEKMSIEQWTPNLPIIRDLNVKKVLRHELDHADIHIDNMVSPDLRKKQEMFDRKTLHGILQIHYYL